MQCICQGILGYDQGVLDEQVLHGYDMLNESKFEINFSCLYVCCLYVSHKELKAKSENRRTRTYTSVDVSREHCHRTTITSNKRKGSYKVLLTFELIHATDVPTQRGHVCQM